MSKSVSKVFGGGGSPGALGTGRYQPIRVKIAEESFKKQLAGQGTQEEVRKAQRRLSEALEAQSKGEGPSVAEKQLQRGQEAAVKRARAEAAATRSGSPALTARETQRTAQEGQREVAAEAAQLRADEQLKGKAALAQQLAQEREQDISIAEGDRSSLQALESLKVQEAGQANRVAVAGFNSAATRRQNLVSGIGSALAFSDEDLKENVKDAEKGAGKSMSKLGEALKGKSRREKNKDKSKEEMKRFLDSSSAESEEGRVAEKAGKGIGLSFKNLIGGKEDEADPSSLEASDEDLKSNINPGAKASKEFIKKVKAKTFNYKDEEKFGEGKHLGVMAQDLEKAGPIGKSMVMDTPEGKMVDFGKGFGAILAAQAQMQKELEAIQAKKSKGKSKAKRKKD